MSTILKYSCGCQYYSNSETIEVLHLCDNHKIQAYNSALQEVIPKVLTDKTSRMSI